MKHLSLHENHIWDCVQHNKIEVLHIYVKLNVSDIFTKEFCDGEHFRALRNIFMHIRQRI